MATVFDKIWNDHEVIKEDESLIYIDLHLIHEVTSPQAFDLIREKNLNVHAPHKTYATMDHSIRTDGKEYEDLIAKHQVETLEKNVEEFGIEIAKINTKNQGIVHVIGPELGLSMPGKTIVCGDSHTATHGAFATIAFGIGTSEVAHVFATQTLWQEKPKNLGINIKGKNEHISAKDVILYILQQYGVSFGVGYAIEFFGEFIENSTMDQRMTICNMAIEGGAKYGLCAFDKTTYEYILKTNSKTKDFEEYTYLKTDENSDFDKIIEINVSTLKPVITWGINPSLSVFVGEVIPEIEDKRSYEYMGLEAGQNISDIKITQVFIGSCTNGRLSDLIEAGNYLKNKKVHDGVRVLVVPGSQKVRDQLVELGYDKIFLDAGCEFRNPGCSSCLGMNNDIMPKYEHVASTSNRNFEGRQGNLARTHLCSVKMACVAAVHGCFKEGKYE